MNAYLKLLYLHLRIFHCQTHFPNFRSASNQNNFKVLFPLCFSQDLQYQNRLQSSLQNFNLQILQLEKLENKYTIGFDLKISPFEMFLLLILIKMTLKSHLRGKAPSTFVTTQPSSLLCNRTLCTVKSAFNYTYPQHLNTHALKKRGKTSKRQNYILL